jgi:transposase
MRGAAEQTPKFFIYTSTEDRIPSDHPLRAVKRLVTKALKALDRDFEKLYSREGRPSIPPEQLLKALLLQIFFGVRSERLLMEQLRYNMLYQWFVGLDPEAEPWNHSTFSKNRDRLIGGEIGVKFFQKVLEQAKEQGLLSSEHFSVDGTLIDAWASMKSFQKKDGSDDEPKDPEEPKGRNEERDFHGEKRSNETHVSKTDPDARLYKKSKGAASRLCYMGHVLMENRNGFAVDSRVTHASGTAEREAALQMAKSASVATPKKISLGADKGYDAKEFVTELRKEKIKAHIAKTRTAGYQISQRLRKRIEEIFGWFKETAKLGKVKQRGIPKLSFLFQLALSAFNLIRMRKCMANG